MSEHCQENNIGSFLGLVVVFGCWIVGMIASQTIQFPALDEFRLVRDLGGHRLIVGTILGAVVGLGWFLWLLHFNNPTCTGICLIIGYFGGGILGLAISLSLAWGIGYWSGLDSRALMVAMSLSGFGLGSSALGSIALGDIEQARTIALLDLLMNGGIILGWLVSASWSSDTQFACMVGGMVVALWIGIRWRR